MGNGSQTESLKSIVESRSALNSWVYQSIHRRWSAVLSQRWSLVYRLCNPGPVFKPVACDPTIRWRQNPNAAKPVGNRISSVSTVNGRLRRVQAKGESQGRKVGSESHSASRRRERRRLMEGRGSSKEPIRRIHKRNEGHSRRKIVRQQTQ